jgi:hypothetical protein
MIYFGWMVQSEMDRYAVLLLIMVTVVGFEKIKLAKFSSTMVNILLSLNALHLENFMSMKIKKIFSEKGYLFFFRKKGNVYACNPKNVNC